MHALNREGHVTTISGNNIYRRYPGDTWKVRLKLAGRIPAFETGTTDQCKATAQAVATRRAVQEQGAVFEPETVELMTDAYLATCQVLGLKANLDDGVTRLIALRIIGAAANGERDPAKLCEHGVHTSSRPVAKD
jgi:hypothetical protein